MPTRKPQDTLVLTIIVALRCLIPRPIHLRYQEISMVIQREVHQALKRNQTAANATTRMATAIQAIIDSPPPEESP